MSTAESHGLSAAPSDAPLLVACLCAQWCGVCRDYTPVLKGVLADMGPAPLAAVWVDIEDQDEVVGDFDVENFPTLLLARHGQALFFGTVVPHAQTLQRLVQNALDGGLPALPFDPEIQGLLQRVMALQADTH